MPDSYLDERLAQARTELLDAIHQPSLGEIAGRGRALRRRRRAARSGIALAAVAAVAVAVLRPWAGSPEATIQPAATPTAGLVYADAGITINGLEDVAAIPGIPDVPGAITDVEFADPDHGYLITDRLTFASTQDGGLTWQRRSLPPNPGELILFPDGRLALSNGYLSSDGGRTWRSAPRPDTSAPAAAGKDELLRLGSPGAVEVWSPQYGRTAVLAQPPPLTMTWVAARRTADGVWWVGGTAQDGSGRPALASSRDGGRTWQPVTLDAPPGQAQVSVLGRHAYATVLGADRKIRAILHSVDGGRTFAPTRTDADADADAGAGADASGGGSAGAEPATLAGEAVPLLDGRLLVTTAAHRWYVSDDGGATFTEASGTLPMVGAVRRTWAGYVAYDLFGPAPAGWAAFSSDGSTWRKLHIR
jgi:Photosynthesis system II assembly factor YCF48